MARSLAGACVAFLLASAAQANEADDIVVKGDSIGLGETGWSVTDIDVERLRALGSANVDQIFRHVPGMAVRDFGLGGVANGIVIRGFGNGGHGGDLGAVIDGIPLNEAMSHADGYVDFNMIIPLEVGEFSVFRGPVSALHGTYNRGGLVNIETRKGGDYAEIAVDGGSFNSVGGQFALGQGFAGREVNLAAQIVLAEGHRPRSGQERQTIAGRWAMKPADNVGLALSGRFHRADANSAGYLTAAQFQTEPRGIDPHVRNDGARKHYASVRGDLNWDVTPAATLLLHAYGAKQDFTRWFTRPVGGGTWRQREESYDRSIFGAGASLNGGFQALDEDAWTYVVGVESVRETTSFDFYDGLAGRTRQGSALNDRSTRLDSMSAFGEVKAHVHRHLTLSLAGRYDRYRGGCTPDGPEAGGDPCGELKARERFNPKLGLRLQLSSDMQLRASWSQGFALPNNFIKYAVGGQPLRDNLFRQTEVGLQIWPIAGLTLDVAGYRLKSTAEIRVVAPGIYENLGSTRRQGIEASAEWKSDHLMLRAVYGLADSEVLDNADARLIGRPVAAVPRQTANADAEWKLLPRLAVTAAWRHVGGYAIDALGTAHAPAYDLFDLGLAHEGQAPFNYRLWLRLENIADNVHATSISLIGGELLFAPGAPRTIRAGIQISL